MSGVRGYVVEDSCRCGAEFATEGQVQGYLEAHHLRWLEAHRVCRGTYPTVGQVVELAEPVVEERTAPAVVPHQEVLAAAARLTVEWTRSPAKQYQVREPWQAIADGLDVLAREVTA